MIEKLHLLFGQDHPVHLQIEDKINEIIEVVNDHTENNLPNTVLKHAHVLKGPDS